MSKQTQIVVNLDILVRNWVDEDVLFCDGNDTNLYCDTDLTFWVMIPKEQGFFLRAKKKCRPSCVLTVSYVNLFSRHV